MYADQNAHMLNAYANNNKLHDSLVVVLFFFFLFLVCEMIWLLFFFFFFFGFISNRFEINILWNSRCAIE